VIEVRQRLVGIRRVLLEIEPDGNRRRHLNSVDARLQ
jgi:hypothetical protein